MPLIKLAAKNLHELICIAYNEPTKPDRTKQILHKQKDYELTLVENASFRKAPEKFMQILKLIALRVNKLQLNMYGFNFPFEKISADNITAITLDYQTVMPIKEDDITYPKFDFLALPALTILTIKGTLTMQGVSLFLDSLKKQTKTNLEELHITTPRLYRHYGLPKLFGKKGLAPSKIARPLQPIAKNYEDCAPDTYALLCLYLETAKKIHTLHSVTLINKSFERFVAVNRYMQKIEEDLLDQLETNRFVEETLADEPPLVLPPVITEFTQRQQKQQTAEQMDAACWAVKEGTQAEEQVRKQLEIDLEIIAPLVAQTPELDPPAKKIAVERTSTSKPKETPRQMSARVQRELDALEKRARNCYQPAIEKPALEATKIKANAKVRKKPNLVVEADQVVEVFRKFGSKMLEESTSAPVKGTYLYALLSNSLNPPGAISRSKSAPTPSNRVPVESKKEVFSRRPRS